MDLMVVIGIVVLAVIATVVVLYFVQRRQKAAMQDEMYRLKMRLMEMEKRVNTDNAWSQAEEDAPATAQASPSNPLSQGREETPTVDEGSQHHAEVDATTETKANNDAAEVEKVDLSGMTDEELFQHITRVIMSEEMFRWPDFNRAAAMEHFSLSAARIGSAFAKGGGRSLPEYVRNCRLDYACRLMVEQPDLNFVQIGKASGFQLTTTFYHDFKARFGVAPAEYRERELKVKSDE